MRDYQSYTLTDLMLDEDFIRWVQEQRPADQAFWEEWLRTYPEKKPLIIEARRILESVDIREKYIPKEEVQQETARLLKVIGAAPAQDLMPSITRPFLRRLWPAAAVLIIGVSTWLLFIKNIPKTTETPAYAEQVSARHLIERINHGDKPDTAHLVDGSWIRIAPNSRIAYSTGFDTAAIREVYLSGEAFFQVAKSPHHPFHVITGNVTTVVLGTSFCIRSFEKDTTIQVTVRSGKVSVSGIILTPNQRLIYKKAAQSYQRQLLDHPVMVAPEITDESMTYEETPVEQVFGQLSKAYGVSIVYDNELLHKCTVTADLKGETFYHKLDLICRAIGAEYEVIDGQVIIQSGGCK
ncbi:MAG TPA: FecR family protein [Puia sp.]|nr:FecR family protein [Puia sp.]